MTNLFWTVWGWNERTFPSLWWPRYGRQLRTQRIPTIGIRLSRGRGMTSEGSFGSTRTFGTLVIWED